jgi:hypothetical protein
MVILVAVCLLVGFASVMVFLIGAGLIDGEKLAETLVTFYEERDQ